MTKPASSSAPIQRQSWEVAASDALPINLEVRYRTGDGCFFPYAYLVFCRYDRGGTIELHFSSWVLQIEGRNLGDLYAALNKHAVSHVQEGENDVGGSESAPYISRLAVSESED